MMHKHLLGRTVKYGNKIYTVKRKSDGFTDTQVLARPHKNKQGEVEHNLKAVLIPVAKCIVVKEPVYWRRNDGSYVDVDDMHEIHIKNAFKVLIRANKELRKQIKTAIR